MVTGDVREGSGRAPGGLWLSSPKGPRGFRKRPKRCLTSHKLTYRCRNGPATTQHRFRNILVAVFAESCHTIMCLSTVYVKAQCYAHVQWFWSNSQQNCACAYNSKQTRVCTTTNVGMTGCVCCSRVLSVNRSCSTYLCIKRSWYGLEPERELHTTVSERGEGINRGDQ